ATSALQDRVAGMRHKLAMLAHEELDPKFLEVLVDVQEEAVRGVSEAPKLTALQESEREDTINDWLDEHEIPGGWELAPIFVGAGERNQVWTNLIDNAIQAMNGHGTLTVRTSMDGDRVRVEIGDTGPGVPPKLRRRIFEPFFTTKPVGQGTGLGLDISYR